MVHDLDFEVTHEVVNSWEAIRRIPNYKQVVGCMIYQQLFARCPQIRVLFGFPVDMDISSNNVVLNSKRFVQHAQFLIAMLDRSFDLLGQDLELLTLELTNLGKRHVNYGVTQDMYPIMGEALLDTLKKLLGNKLTFEAEEAWKDVYKAITDDMIPEE